MSEFRPPAFPAFAMAARMAEGLGGSLSPSPLAPAAEDGSGGGKLIPALFPGGTANTVGLVGGSGSSAGNGGESSCSPVATLTSAPGGLIAAADENVSLGFLSAVFVSFSLSSLSF